MNKLALIGIVAVVMVAAAAVAAVATPSAFANRGPPSRSDDDRNNVNVCRDCQSAQNSGDNSLNTNGGVFQTR